MTSNAQRKNTLDPDLVSLLVGARSELWDVEPHLGFTSINVPAPETYSVPALWWRRDVQKRIRDIQRAVENNAVSPLSAAPYIGCWQETTQTTAGVLFPVREDKEKVVAVLVGAFLHDLVGANGNRNLLPREWRGDTFNLLSEARHKLGLFHWHQASANSLPGSGSVMTMGEFMRPTDYYQVGKLAAVAIKCTLASHQFVHLVGMGGEWCRTL